MGLKKITKRKRRIIRGLPALCDKKASELTPLQKDKVLMQMAEHFGIILENDL